MVLIRRFSCLNAACAYFCIVSHICASRAAPASQQKTGNANTPESIIPEDRRGTLMLDTQPPAYTVATQLLQRPDPGPLLITGTGPIFEPFNSSNAYRPNAQDALDIAPGSASVVFNDALRNITSSNATSSEIVPEEQHPQLQSTIQEHGGDTVTENSLANHPNSTPHNVTSSGSPESIYSQPEEPPKQVAGPVPGTQPSSASAVPSAETTSLPSIAQTGSSDSTTSADGGTTIKEPAAPPIQNIPITAFIYGGSPGPSSCRGSLLANIVLPGTGAQHTETLCYDLPAIPMSCAVFMANKADGCEATLFSSPGCTDFANLAVFMQEIRPVGGVYWSFSITCGVQGVVPPMLNIGGLQLPAGAQIAGG